jgi:hypothetical protein
MTIIINFSVERVTQLLPSHGTAKLAIIMLGYLYPACARTSVQRGALATTFCVSRTNLLGNGNISGDGTGGAIIDLYSVRQRCGW